MAKSSAFTRRFSVSLDRDLVRRIDLLIEDSVFISYAHCAKRAIREWIKNHKGSRFLYSPIEKLEAEHYVK